MSHDHPLPLMDGGEEVERSPELVGSLSYVAKLNPYIIRFTPYEQNDTNEKINLLFGIQEIMDEFLIPNFDTFVITEELSPYTHYHIYLESSMTHVELKKVEQEFIYSYYIDRKRGFGTKQHSCLISTNPLNAITYALKQRGKTEWSGFEESFIEKCRNASFQVQGGELANEVKELVKTFLESDMSPYVLASRISIVYSKFDRNVNWKSIQEFVYSKMIKRDNGQADILCAQFCRF